MSLPHPTPLEDQPALNDTAFSSLRWSIFSPTPNPSITILLEDQDIPNHTHTQTPYTATHPLALQPATNPPSPTLLITATALNEYESQWNDGYESDPEGVENLADHWAYLIVQREDGGAVLVGDVVAQLHVWFNSDFIKQRLREALAWQFNMEPPKDEGGGWMSVSVGVGGEEEVPEGVGVWVEEIGGRWGEDRGERVVRVDVELEVEGFE
ncbi:hypothetical protein T440DRAFT_554291 [Plenodomus tracheiphilus IPT5]|uniref:Uncharacterized protein n=1 Tax=Plenodomus tracheiphilus IPT5 TaxID=1408161 RepID=A0A6A7B798_9PLEO|nr:hypothetical protein T440DRAFT_554291 [Plenodomus tracheiphilus IPT5]